MATNALSRLPTSHVYEAYNDDDIPAYDVDNVHAITDFNMEEDRAPDNSDSVVSPKREHKLSSASQINKCPLRSVFCDKLSILSKRTRLDKATKKIFLLSSWKRMLEKKYSSTISGHPGARQMYNMTRRSYYWLHMVIDDYSCEGRRQS